MSRIRMKPEDVADSKRIKERDGYRCQKCGSSPNPRGLNVHHLFTRSIQPLRHEDDNLITLCTAHHMWAHGHPLEAHEFYRERLGQERYEALSKVAHGWRNRL